VNDKEFVSVRHNFKKTQKQMAELLGISLRSVQSFEQGWRKIPTNIERQILYLVSMKDTQEDTLKPCWEVEDCPPEKRYQCPAWEFNTGHLCWFINGTICQGKAHRNWDEKMKFCRECTFFQHVNSLLENTLSEFHNKDE
jgi:DNA-binding XRE family transcriptional regulator